MIDWPFGQEAIHFRASSIKIFFLRVKFFISGRNLCGNHVRKSISCQQIRSDERFERYRLAPHIPQSAKDRPGVSPKAGCGSHVSERHRTCEDSFLSERSSPVASLFRAPANGQSGF